ncbi:unnamed protein product, partial [marine sediment metagenome]
VAHLVLTGDLFVFKVVTHDDAGAFCTNSVPVATTEHFLECHIEQAATGISADGRGRWWINGYLLQTCEDVDNYDRFEDLAHVRLGLLSGRDPGTSGTFSLDELAANDDGSEIGEKTANPGTMAFYRRRRVV